VVISYKEEFWKVMERYKSEPERSVGEADTTAKKTE
jgi:hypothetical protein